LKNANIPPEQIAEYIGLAGLDEASIDIAVRIALDEKERLRFLASMQLFQEELNDAPPELRLAVADAIAADEYNKANVLIKLMNGQLTPAEIAFVAGVLPDLAPYINQLQVEANANPIGIPVALINPFAGAKAAGTLTTTTGDFNIDFSKQTGGMAPGKAAGGPVGAGMTYTVNEQGRELFTPSTGGFIMNASDTQALLQGVSQLVKGGGGMTNITINETSSPRQTALEVIRANKSSLFLAGAL
jgi:hypothetical protein